MEKRLDNLALSLYKNKNRMSKEHFFSIRGKIAELRKKPPSNIIDFKSKLDRIEEEFIIKRPRAVEISTEKLKISRYFIDYNEITQPAFYKEMLRLNENQDMDLLEDLRANLIKHLNGKAISDNFTGKEIEEMRKKTDAAPREFHFQKSYLEIIEKVIQYKKEHEKSRAGIS